jgi:hypothetical protein
MDTNGCLSCGHRFRQKSFKYGGSMVNRTDTPFSSPFILRLGALWSADPQQAYAQ